MKNKTFNTKAGHIDEDDIHDPADATHDLTFDQLVSYLPDDQKELFIGILSANNLDQSTFEYHMLFDLLALQKLGNVSPLEHREIISNLQTTVSGFYGLSASPSDYVTHGYGYIESALDSNRYRQVCFNTEYHPPITYMGNKLWLTKLIKEKKVIIPQHKLWIEPFCGSATMTLAQQPSPVEIINDFDGYLITFYTVLSQPASRQILLDQLSHYLMIPKTRELHLPLLGKLAKKTKTVNGSGEKRVTKGINIGSADDITLARAYYICAKISYGMRSLGYLDHFEYDENATKKVTPHIMKKWLDTLNRAGRRLENVIIEQGDGLAVIEEYADEKDVFFYIDPPYVMDTRRTGKGDYAGELTNEDHHRLVDLLLRIKGSAILSGYNSQAYIQLEREGWQTLSVEIDTLASKREEMLWIKP
ncbi:DNA adenine methylase [Acidithiobacillus ferriphilus]|uniref:DNA adenine methylase n=1 Tax=Acidithiobacillus ferriphilus TaxID=1689834 RepID=UPI00233120E6|nr:DNA adenine methylase [Acidithiobacillus ferriphilus]WCE94933.1 DNA adenine methylase [Acidithiobacillus ferriphilus]